MKDLEFVFDTPAWEQVLAEAPQGEQLDGVQFLTMLQSASEEDLEAALELLEKRNIALTTDGLELSTSYGNTAARLRYEKELVRRNGLPQELEENDPLRLYLEELAGLPVGENPEVLIQQY